MNNGYTGGPAFPVNTDILSLPDPKAVMGMTLRDYFAAKAMAAIIMNPETQRELIGMDRDQGMLVISKVAYMQADAMLRERAK